MRTWRRAATQTQGCVQRVLCHAPFVCAMVVVALFAPGAAQAQPAAQSFRFCIVDEDEFRIKDVALYISSRPGQFIPIQPLPAERFSECDGEGQFWRFEVINSLDTPGNRAIVEFRFKTENPSETSLAAPSVDSTVTLPVRLLALNKIGEPDNRIDIWIPASVPNEFGPAYLDTLERMTAPHLVQKLMHSAILYDHLKQLYGANSDVTRRAAVVMMNAATDLIAAERDKESLYDIPDFVIDTIEDSLGRQSYWQRLVRRFEESRSAPVVKADQLIRQLVRTGQCDSAREILLAISAYVGDDTYLLDEARVPATHMDDLGAMINQRCRASG